jgi:hypothetical protein
MAVKRTFPNGFKIHGPPYTKLEELELYERMGDVVKQISYATPLGGRKSEEKKKRQEGPK